MWYGLDVLRSTAYPASESHQREMHMHNRERKHGIALGGLLQGQALGYLGTILDYGEKYLTVYHLKVRSINQ